MYDKVLIAMDNSEDAFRAAERVIEIVKSGNSQATKGKPEFKSDTKIVAFHSIKHRTFPSTLPIPVPSSFGRTYTVPRVDYRKLEQEYREHGEKILNKVNEKFNDANLSVETRLVEDEKPEDYISKVVDEEGFDLVALGCKGEHSKLEELVMGTVANDVLNNANSDLLIVR
ncbi:MAG: universal stress protein [Promethearchaeota archaeon]|nr:MAG: universal stress protein [Candidatus Lokiarchaeota archaeon]